MSRMTADRSAGLVVDAELPATPNLITNPGAEDGPGGTGGPVPSIPGWHVLDGEATVIRYDAGGGYPGPNDPGSSQRGRQFFAGGNVPRTRLAQDIVLPDPSGIDRGRARFSFSGWLGGYAGQQDGARLSLEFRNRSGNPTGLVVLGPATAADRGDLTGFVERRATGTVPPYTRWARIVLLFTRSGGTSNDGYADELSLTLTGVRR
jgi:hypothetical protein